MWFVRSGQNKIGTPWLLEQNAVNAQKTASAALGAPPTKKGRSSSKSPVILPSVSPSTCLKTSSPLPSLPPDLPEEETSPDLGSLSQLSVLTASLAAQNVRMDALEQVTQRGGGRLAQQPDHFHQPATGAAIESASLRTDSGFSRPETLRADYPVLAESTYDSLHIAGVSGATPRSSPAGPGVVSVPRVSEGRPAEAALTRGTGHQSPVTSRW